VAAASFGERVTADNTIGFSAGVVALPWQRGQSNVSIGTRAIYWSEVARDDMCSTAHFYIDAEYDSACNLHVAERFLGLCMIFSPATRKNAPDYSATNLPKNPSEETDENPLSSCPCRIGNQLCFADLCPTNKHPGSL